MAQRYLRFGIRPLALLATVWGASSCHEGIDTTRQPLPSASLGDDIYGVLCDRVGAAALNEDLNGASYHFVCHANAEGKYASEVDTSMLPPAADDRSARARRLGIAKVETMGRRRRQLVRAINAIFPDVEIPDPTKDDGSEIRLHDALVTFSQELAPFYETNPYASSPGDPKTALFPTATRAIGRLFDGLADKDEARQALARIWGRQGYRPFRVGLGAIRPALAYPRLRELTKSALAVLGPEGTATAELQQLLTIVEKELLTSRAVVAPLPTLVVDPQTAQPNRPRSNIEVTSAILLTQSDAFAASPDDPPRYLSLRDRRGFVLPAGSVQGLFGSVPAPFVDANPADGFADVDAFGRFVDASGAALAIDPPFAIPGVETGPVDVFGRPLALPYQYVDTSRALTGALGRDLVALVDPTYYASPDDPQGWQSEHETLMYALAGALVLYGDREPAAYDYDTDTIVAPDAGCEACVAYERFRGEDSPIPDLLHALGQILADPESDVLLVSLIDLADKHEQVVARLLGAALEARQISLDHDAFAVQGVEPFATMPYETPIWDEMAELLGRMSQKPGFLRKMLDALADPRVVTPAGGSEHMGQTLADFMEMKDEFQYDPNNINGPTRNLTDASSTADPKHPVDRTQPKNGKNRSLMQRSLQAIHDASHTRACNKEGARLHIDLGIGLPIKWPLVGSYAECELFQFDDLAGFYLRSLLPADHPKRAELAIKSGVLNGIMNFMGIFVPPDQLFQDISGVTGLTLHPEPAALNRLVLFGARTDEYGNLADHDYLNEGSKTETFIHESIEPVAGYPCPAKANQVRHCSDPNDLLRLRDYATLFGWERLGFYDYLQPIMKVFAEVSCTDSPLVCDTADTTGEQFFVDLVDILHRHWPGKDHGSECDPSGDASQNTRYCSEAGVNSYEPILADVFRSDIIPALHEFAKVAKETTLTVERGPAAGTTITGTEVLEKMTRILFDPKYAAQVGMVDRRGSAVTTWVNGKVQPQLTTFNLFTDALHGIDQRFDRACACDGLGGDAFAECTASYDACRADAEMRKGQWKRARSQLVDQFMTVSGKGTEARFENPGTPKTLLAVLRVLREQLNANCPARESGQACTWAKTELSSKLSTTLSGPLFAALMDLQESIRRDEPARRELEKMLAYVLEAASDNDARQATLASMSDILQLLQADADMSPIFQAVASVATPKDGEPGPGAADTIIQVLQALTADEHDRYHVIDHLLPLLVTPMDDGEGLTPIEVFLDTAADVNREDAETAEPLRDEDYELIMGTVRDFLTSETRGLEQFYYIVQNRPRE